ncbi:MAG: hypothetical protein AAFY76_07690, partial [Cyanobacteria bacterium J06649_11]
KIVGFLLFLEFYLRQTYSVKRIHTPQIYQPLTFSILRSGNTFIQKYEGKNIVKGYAKWYGVDKLCAIKELRMLGVDISEEYESVLRNKSVADKTQETGESPRFLIVEETSNGVPFGHIYDEDLDYLDEQALYAEDRSDSID